MDVVDIVVGGRIRAQLDSGFVEVIFLTLELIEMQGWLD